MRFLKASNGKPIELGLNFTKKSDKPGYTVKKFTETKIEEKSTSFGKTEFGLSFQKKEVTFIALGSLISFKNTGIV